MGTTNTPLPAPLISLPQAARHIGVPDVTLARRLEKAGIHGDFVVQAGLRGSAILFRPERLEDLRRAVGVPTPIQPIV